jgi:predicted dehydrogenase
MKNLKYGFIGCGLATFERAKALPEENIVCCLDGYDKVERQFCATFDAVSVDFDTMMTMVDVVFVCAPHQYLFDYSVRALNAGKHVMVEKPGAVTPEELSQLNQIAQEKNLVCHVGYTLGNVLLNYGFIKPNPHSILGNYCHGAREGYDNEWRMRENSLGGGVSYDLLTHITHMSLLCDGNLDLVSGSKANSYWKTAGEDTAMAILKNNSTGAVASLFASCSDWKKNFNLSLNYLDNKIEVKNLNARNGDFILITHANTGPGIIPETTEKEITMPFWILDTQLFLNKIFLQQVSI